MVTVVFEETPGFEPEYDVVIRVGWESHARKAFEAMYKAFTLQGYSPENWRQACEEFVEYGEDSFYED